MTEFYFILVLLFGSGVAVVLLFVVVFLSYLKERDEKEFLKDDSEPIKNCKWWR